MLAGGSEFALAAVAAGMAIVVAYLVKWAYEAHTRTAAAVVLFLFGMMIAMLAGALVYFQHPGTARLVDGLWLASASMSASVFPLVAVFVKDAQARLRDGSRYVPAPVSHRRAFALAVVALVVANEALMGATFGLAAGSFPIVAGGGGPALLVAAVDSPWFLFPMALEMGLTVYLLRSRLPRGIAALLLAQAALMALSPPAFGGPDQGAAVMVAGGALMIAIVVFVLEYLYRNRALLPAVSAYLVGLLGAYAAMMAGIYAWQRGAGGLLFALAVLAEMALFFDLVVVGERFDAPSGRPWQERPGWTTALLSEIFVAELFMGASLDLALQPASYAALLPAIAPPSLGALGAAASASFWFFANVTASTWFLAMMGIEMGLLVAFKFRESRVHETKIRLALMMGCYGAFAVFFPSAYYAAVLPTAAAGTAVPVLGWSMGIGSAPIGPAVFGVLLLTYAITGTLSALFGRRVICSTFCTAALMYQGTTIDAMKSFNRSSPIAHKFLGSRFSRAYSVTSGTVLAALVGSATVSYLDTTGRLAWSIGGVDPTVFLFAASFGVLWYLLFVTIPYAGTYSCVTMGYCYTGTIAQAFQRLGPFSLRVKDPELCRRCTTLDCAKSCPVGLVDMPGHFRTKGVFRSSKCCGVGSCAGACPYGNLYLYDIRHWFGERWAARRGRPMGTALPVLSGLGAGERAPPARPTTANFHP